jgi:hypothetical protein
LEVQGDRNRQFSLSNRAGKDIAPGRHEDRTGLEKTSHPAGSIIEPGWNSIIGGGWKRHRTRLEETSHPVGKDSLLNIYITECSAAPKGLKFVHKLYFS